MQPRRQLNTPLLETHQLKLIKDYPPPEKALRFSKTQLQKMGLQYEGGGLVRINGKIYTFISARDNPNKNLLLGKGDFGKVKLLQNVEDPFDKIALKVMSVYPGDEPAFFQEELEVAEALGRGSKQIIEKVGGSGSTYCGVLVLMPGVKLEDFIESNPSLDIRKRFEIIIKCLKELLWMHAKKYTHNDIALRNFMYDNATGDVKIIDFGLAAALEPKYIKNDITQFAHSILGKLAQNELFLDTTLLKKEQKDLWDFYQNMLIGNVRSLSTALSQLDSLLKKYLEKQSITEEKTQQTTSSSNLPYLHKGGLLAQPTASENRESQETIEAPSNNPKRKFTSNDT